MEGCLLVFAANAMAYGDLLDLAKSCTLKLPVDWFQL
jgi:hypothetical protein